MEEKTDIEKAADELLNFAEFYLSLGEMKSADMLIAIENRDPEFADYFQAVTEPVRTAADFFRIYAGWALQRIRQACGVGWAAVTAGATGGERFHILEMQCKGQTLMWADVEGWVGKWNNGFRAFQGSVP